LNRIIRKSVNHIKKRKRLELTRKVKRLDLQSQQRINTICQQFMTFLKSKNGSFEYETEDEVTDILNEYFTDGLVLPERFVFLVRNMSLVYLIVEFETFLKEILVTTFEKKPEILTSSQKSVTLEELLTCHDLESTKEILFSKVASEVVSRPVIKTVEYFEQDLGICTQGYDVDWKKFYERFFRRNVLVHNQGIPDKTYRRETGCSGKKENLMVSEGYLNETVKLFDVVAYNMFVDLQNKFHA